MKKLLLSTIIVILFIVIKAPSNAQESQSESYKLDSSSVNQVQNFSQSAEYLLEQFVGATETESSPSSSNFVINTVGTANKKPVGITISNSVVNLGKVVKESFLEGSLGIDLKTTDEQPMTLIVYQQRPLSNPDNSSILPNTNCQSGKKTRCTQFKALPWTETKTTGFGYTVKGKTIPADFKNGTNYRIFPDLVNHQSPIKLFSSSSTHRCFYHIQICSFHCH